MHSLKIQVLASLCLIAVVSGSTLRQYEYPKSDNRLLKSRSSRTSWSRESSQPSKSIAESGARGYNGANNYHPYPAPASSYVQEMQKQRSDLLKDQKLRARPSTNFYERPHQRYSNFNRIIPRSKQLVRTRQGSDSGDTYDPFYFYSRSAAPYGRTQPRGTLTAADYLRVSAPTGNHSPRASYTRNRRNSRLSNFYAGNEFNGKLYNILTKEPFARYRENVEGRDYGNRASDKTRFHTFNKKLHGTQFLTRDEIFGRDRIQARQQESNDIEFFKRTGPASSPQRGQPWSVQIGTKLQVKDNGRSDHSQFYVRDERKPYSKRRHPIY